MWQEGLPPALWRWPRSPSVPAPLRAADPVITVGADGKTAPVFSYADAKRERVWIPVAGVDQDANGVTDRVAIDIIRPKESGPNLKVPAIIDDSPYYTSVGRGNETQFIHTTADGVLDKFPLFYDNYFVPRGYAVILAHSIGTAFSTGCPLHGGPGDVAGFKAVIDWTEGRVPGYTSSTGDTPVLADWSNGKNAMIGKSYDGTFANGVAATGVDGLTTIVPISAISDWYDYSRMGGIRENTHYPRSLDNSITATQSLATLGVLPPDHRDLVRERVHQPGPDRRRRHGRHQRRSGTTATTTRTSARSRRPSSSRTASTTTTSARTSCSRWWAGLAANNVPRKLWLSLEGHVDPFEYRRTEWVNTLHRWFDYWLQGVQNGIMDRAARGHRDVRGHVHDVRRLADPEHDAHRRLPRRPRRRQVRLAAAQLRRRHRQPRVHRQRAVGDQRDQLARTARRPTACRS